MEPTTTAFKFLTKERLQLIEKFIVYILLLYFIYENKQGEIEKTKILQQQIEVLSKNKDSENQQLQIINKLINENPTNNSDSKHLPN